MKTDMKLLPVLGDRGFWITAPDRADPDKRKTIPVTENVPYLEMERSRFSSSRKTGEELLMMLKYV